MKKDSQILFHDLLVRITLQAMRYCFKVLGMWDGLFLKSLELIGFGVLRVSLKRGELFSELLLRRCAINSNGRAV